MTPSKGGAVRGSREDPAAYETLHVRTDGSVLFAKSRLRP